MASKIAQSKPHLALSFGGLIFWATQGVNFIQDVTTHRFTTDDKTFVAATVAMILAYIGLYFGVTVQGLPNLDPAPAPADPSPAQTASNIKVFTEPVPMQNVNASPAPTPVTPAPSGPQPLQQ